MFKLVDSVGEQTANNPKMLPALEVSEAVKVLVVIALSQPPAGEFRVYVGMDTAWSIGKSEKILAYLPLLWYLPPFFLFFFPQTCIKELECAHSFFCCALFV